MVELGYWLRLYTPNYESHNILGVPPELSGKIEFLLIPVMFLFILLVIKSRDKIKWLFYIVIVMLFINIFTGLYNETGIINSFQLCLKLTSPVLFFVVLVLYYNKYGLDIKKLAKTFIWLCLILSVVALLFFNPSANRGPQLFLPIFFESIHTHSYVLACLFVMISYPMYRSKKYGYLLLFLVASFLFLRFGYNVRTALLFYLVYIGIVLFQMHSFFKYLWLQVLIYVPLIILFIGIFFNEFDLNQYSSGRLGMYAEKVDQIKTFNWVEVLLGRGLGSDKIRSETWIYGTKGAHSDVITFFVENGLIFLLLYFLLIFTFLFLRRKTNIIYLALILGYVLSSIISNGITTRPLAGYLFFMALAMIYILSNGEKNSVNELSNSG